MPTSGSRWRRASARRSSRPSPVPFDEMRPAATTRSPASPTWTGPGSSRRCASRRSRASAARSSGRPTTRSSRMLCVQAYNDWMIDEWCGAAPGRLHPADHHPAVGPGGRGRRRSSAARRKGAHAVAFSENPEPLGLPTIHDPDRYWDPVMAAAKDNEIVVCMHVGSSSTMPAISSDAPGAREPDVRRGARRRDDARLAVQRLLRPDARAEDRAVGGQHRLDAVLPRARRAGGRQAAALGEEHVARASTTTTVRPRTRPMADLDNLDVRATVPRPHLRVLHRGASGSALPRHHRRGQRDDRDRLPAQRHHVARLHRGRAEAARATCPPETQYKILRGNAERLFRFTPRRPRRAA